MSVTLENRSRTDHKPSPLINQLNLNGTVTARQKTVELLFVLFGALPHPLGENSYPLTGLGE